MRDCTLLIEQALSDGHTVSVWDGEAWAVKRSKNYHTIFSACDAVDDVVRLLIRDNQGEKIGSVYVLDDGDTRSIIDHTDTPYLNRVMPYVESWASNAFSNLDSY